MLKIQKVIVDIKNYIDLQKILKIEEKNSPKWAKFNIRRDWIGRIYTVYNLPPEVTLSPDVPKEAWIGYVLEQSKPLNEYLTTLNLQEIIQPDYREIPGTESFLLIYKPFFQELSWRWILTRIGFWSLVIYLQCRHGVFTNIWHWITNII